MKTLNQQYTPVVRPNMIPHSMVNVTGAAGEYIIHDFGVLPEKLVPGETYTMTIHGTTTDAEGRQWLRVVLWNDTWSQDVQNLDVRHGETQRIVTFVAGDSWAENPARVTAYHTPNRAGMETYGYSTIDWVKLEHGAEATPWAPYPQDEYDLVSRIRALENAAGMASDPGLVEGPEIMDTGRKTAGG